MPLGNLLGLGFNALLNVAVPAALGVGTQFASGLITRELNRSQRNDADDAFKAALRAAASAVSPTVAIGQTAVPVGGPATGTAFQPATLIPPGILPAGRALETDPNFFPRNESFQGSRRDPSLGFVSQTAGFAAGSFIQRGAQLLLGRGARPPTAFPFGSSFPVGPPIPTVSDRIRARREAFVPEGPLPRVGAQMPVAPPATGLPSVGRFQREANGCLVQWYFWDGTGSPQPIDRSQADCFRKECIFRLDVFRGKFVKMGSRRMNPMNVRAFFRAGRRVDAGERICRKMFSEKRKQKTGTIRRKSRGRKK